MSDPIDGTAVDDHAAPAAAQSHELVAYQAATVVGPPQYARGSTDLFAGLAAQERVDAAAAIARVLDGVIKKSGARTKMGRSKVVREDGTEAWEDRYHVNVEAWQTLATLLGAVLVERYVRPAMDAYGHPILRDYVARQRTTRNKGKANEEVVELEIPVQGHDWEAVVDVVKDGVVIGTGSALCSRSETTWSSREEFSLRSMAATRATSRAVKQAAAWIVTLAGYSSTPAEEMPGHDTPEQEPAAPALPAWAGPFTGDMIRLRERLAGILNVSLDDEIASGVIDEALGKLADDITPEGEARHPITAVQGRVISWLAYYVNELEKAHAPAVRSTQPAPTPQERAHAARAAGEAQARAEAARASQAPPAPVTPPPAASSATGAREVPLDQPMSAEEQAALDEAIARDSAGDPARDEEPPAWWQGSSEPDPGDQGKF